MKIEESMTLEEFKKKLWYLAQEQSSDLRSIQALITTFFKNKAIPNLQSTNSFVVRASINAPGEVFRTASRCSYPPNEAIEKIKIQRSNYPGQQVFYCTIPTKSDFASAQSTCVAETAWEYIEDINQNRFYMTLSRWQCSRPLNLWVLPFCKGACEKNNDWKDIQTNMRRIIEGTKRNTNILIEALEYISEAFAERTNKKIYYKITSAFYNALLFYENFKGTFLDGLMYPSANTEGAGINIVLKKELVDAGVLTCELAMMFSVQRDPNNTKNISIMPATREVKIDEKGNLYFPNIW